EILASAVEPSEAVRAAADGFLDVSLHAGAKACPGFRQFDDNECERRQMREPYATTLCLGPDPIGFEPAKSTAERQFGPMPVIAAISQEEAHDRSHHFPRRLARDEDLRNFGDQLAHAHAGEPQADSATTTQAAPMERRHCNEL